MRSDENAYTLLIVLFFLLAVAFAVKEPLSLDSEDCIAQGKKADCWQAR